MSKVIKTHALLTAARPAVRALRVIAALFCSCTLGSQSFAAFIISPLPASDTLTATGGGIVAKPTGGTWASSAQLIAKVSQLTPTTWHYDYEWITSGKDLSHIIIEVTDGAKRSDFFNISVNAELESEDPRTYSPSDPGNSNPGLPGSIYGLKFEPKSETSDFKFSFDSNHAPVYGDFYAKDGKEKIDKVQFNVYAYNSGFSAAGPGDFSPSSHTIVPDGLAVPEPTTVIAGGLLLLPLGVTAMRALRRRR